MRRDMDLVRAILLATEASEDADGLTSVRLEFPGREERIVYAHSAVLVNTRQGEDRCFLLRCYRIPIVSYHVRLLEEGGLLAALNLSSVGEGLRYEPRRLTWAGHEFLDLARDEQAWRQAKKVAREKTGSLAFEVVRQLLVRLALVAAGLG